MCKYSNREGAGDLPNLEKAHLRYGLLLLMFAPLGVLADTGSTTVMHRIDAGLFDSSGWALAESTNGSFAVRMPGPFNDFSVSGGPDDIADHIEGIGGKAPNGIVFTALKLLYNTKGTASAEFESFKGGADLPSAKVKSVTLAGLQALDISYGDEKSSTNERVILDGETLFTLTVQWPGAEATPALAMVQPFLESFRVMPKTAPRIENPTIWQHDQLNQNFMRTLTKDVCMKKTIATLSRYGCATQQCLANVAGATGDCLTWASGETAAFCAAYDSSYVDKACAPGGLDKDRCTLLNNVKRGLCSPPGK
jgi:hypothetical protein